MKILIAEDEPDVVEALTLGFHLQWQGCEVVTAPNGQVALELFAKENPDIVLLDIAMPKLDGFEVLHRIRQASDVPVLMLTVKADELDKVKALELGADDYITKPFGALELLARIKAVLRRAEILPSTGTNQLFMGGDLSIDFESHEVTVRERQIRLTPREFTLLAYLARNANRVIPQRTILVKVWGTDYENDTDSLKVYIRRLRQKIEDEPEHPQYILTERGLGYRLVRPV